MYAPLDNLQLLRQIFTPFSFFPLAETQIQIRDNSTLTKAIDFFFYDWVVLIKHEKKQQVEMVWLLDLTQSDNTSDNYVIPSTPDCLNAKVWCTNRLIPKTSKSRLNGHIICNFLAKQFVVKTLLGLYATNQESVAAPSYHNQDFFLQSPYTAISPPRGFPGIGGSVIPT